MQVKARIPWSLCVVLVVLVLWLAFNLIDQSVTVSHQMQYINELVEQKNLLEKVLNASANTGNSEIKLRALLQQFSATPPFDKGESEVVASQISFFFQDGHLVRVDAGE